MVSYFVYYIFVSPTLFYISFLVALLLFSSSALQIISNVYFSGIKFTYYSDYIFFSSCISRFYSVDADLDFFVFLFLFSLWEYIPLTVAVDDDSNLENWFSTLKVIILESIERNKKITRGIINCEMRKESKDLSMCVCVCLFVCVFEW